MRDVPRTINPFSAGFTRNYERLKIGGTETAKKVGRVVTALMRADVLPGSDAEAIMPPSGKAWVRKVPGTSLWLWYTFTDDTLTLRALTTFPPPPPP